MEDKNERFKRIAEKRTNNILEQLRLLGNCSNKSNYAYTEAEVRRIFQVIEAETRETKMRFSSKLSKDRFIL